MSGIHKAIMDRVETVLQTALIDNIDPADIAIAGVVKQGPLQGDPEPDTARVSVTIHENDPGNFDENEEWADKIDMLECGGAITWARRFTVKIRCLLELSQEDLATARQIASTVKERAEIALLSELFTGVVSGNERVSRGVFAETLSTQMRQSGGPPDAYDFHIKIRFDVLSTRTGVYQ